MANLNAPVVSGIDRIIKIGESSPISTFFSVTDADGDEIVEYSVMDGNGDADSGYLTLNGTLLGAGVFHSIAAEDLANLRYHAGSAVGKENIRIRANDGLFNSNTANSVTFSVNENTTRPIMTAKNQTSVANEFIEISSLFAGSDPDGWPGVRYKFRDRNAKSHSGYFMLDGIRMASNRWFYVEAEDIDKLQYFTGTARSSETLLGRFYDGDLWSPVARSKFRTNRNQFRPEVEALYIAKGASEEFPITELFNVSDKDNNTTKTYRFRDAGQQADSGFITINGVVQPARVWLTVKASDLANTTYTTGSVNRLDNIAITVNDGRFVSKAETAFVAVTTRPVIEPSKPRVFDGDEIIDLVSIIDQSDDGPRNVLYRIYDDSDNPFSLRFEMNGSVLNPKQLYEFTAAEIAQVKLRTGDFNTRRLDEIFIQTFNGQKWSVVRSLKAWTEPRLLDALANVEDTTIIARNSWRLWLGGAPNEPLQITYSFREQISPDILLFTSRFTNAERIQTRRVLDRLESIYDIDFVEISDNFIDDLTGNQGGTLRIGHGAADFAFAPDDTADAHWGGDIFMTDAHIIDQLAPGTLAHSTFLRLIGNALGLRDANTTTQYFNPLLFKWPLPTDTDDQRHTSMSYNYNPDNQTLDAFGFPTGTVVPVERERLGVYDAYALEHLYDFNPTALAGDDVYGNTGDSQNINDWSEKVFNFDLTEIHDAAFQTSITGDTGGIDTIDVSNMLVTTSIDLTPGSYSSIGEITLDFVDFFPATNNVSIGHNTIIENVIGGDSSETITGNFADNLLIGGEGNDTLRGGGGEDTLVGGGGNDRYIWHLSDQSTLIQENLGGGNEILEINSHWALDDFTEDFKFSRNGTDLLIDLTINDDLSQGVITIEDQGRGLSRVESMRINYTDGSFQFVDMRSIYDLATPSQQQFVLTEDFTVYGFIAAIA